MSVTLTIERGKRNSDWREMGKLQTSDFCVEPSRCGRTLTGFKRGAGQSKLKEGQEQRQRGVGGMRKQQLVRARAGAAHGVCRREHESKNVQSARAWTPC